MQANQRILTVIKEKLEELARSAKDLSRTQMMILAVLMFALLLSAGINYYKSRPVEINVKSPGESASEKENMKIAVHVTGEVVKPGLYEVEEGSRVSDAVNKAGGPTPGASLESINLAARVKDGTQIIVPPVAVAVDGAAEQGGTVQQTAKSNLVNINSADEHQLDELPGIGPSYAARIIEYRKENGPFSSIDELQNVKGIGPRTIEQIEGLVTL